MAMAKKKEKEKVMVAEDVPWRALPAGKRPPVPRIHHSPVLRSPHNDHALAVMKRPDPIGDGFAVEAKIESAGPECIVPGHLPPLKLLGLKVWPLTGIDLKFMEPVGRELQSIGKVVRRAVICQLCLKGHSSNKQYTHGGIALKQKSGQ